MYRIVDSIFRMRTRQDTYSIYKNIETKTFKLKFNKYLIFISFRFVLLVELSSVVVFVFLFKIFFFHSFFVRCTLNIDRSSVHVGKWRVVTDQHKHAIHTREPSYRNEKKVYESGVCVLQVENGHNRTIYVDLHTYIPSNGQLNIEA